MPEVINNKKLFRFEINPGENSLTYLEYRWKKGDMLLMRTFVPVAERGKGMGALLVKTAMQYAVEKGLKVVVYCPFIDAYVKTHTEYNKLLAG